MKKKKPGAPVKYNWLVIKKDYVTNPQMTFPMLVKKYGVNLGTVQIKAAQEKWTLLRQQINDEAEKRLIHEDSINEIVEIKRRHIQVGKLMQKVGLEALEKYKYIPRSSKEAREFLVEGIKVEREALGMNNPKNQSPAIVNIIGRRDPSLDKYVEGVIVEESTEEEDGKK